MVNPNPDSYVQVAVDQLRADLRELKASLEAWGQLCVNKEDLLCRVQDWQFNAWVHSEDILQQGIVVENKK